MNRAQALVHKLCSTSADKHYTRKIARTCILYIPLNSGRSSRRTNLRTATGCLNFQLWLIKIKLPTYTLFRMYLSDNINLRDGICENRPINMRQNNYNSNVKKYVTVFNCCQELSIIVFVCIRKMQQSFLMFAYINIPIQNHPLSF